MWSAPSQETDMPNTPTTDARGNNPDLDRRMRAAVFEALNNAAEGGYDHTNDHKDDRGIARSLRDHDEDCERISLTQVGSPDPADMEQDEGHLNQCLDLIAPYVGSWRTLRRQGMALPVSCLEVDTRVVWTNPAGAEFSGTLRGFIAPDIAVVDFENMPGQTVPISMLAPEQPETFGEFTAATVLAAGNIAPRSETATPAEAEAAFDQWMADDGPMTQLAPPTYPAIDALRRMVATVQETERTNTRSAGVDYDCRVLLRDHGDVLLELLEFYK